MSSLNQQSLLKDFFMLHHLAAGREAVNIMRKMKRLPDNYHKARQLIAGDLKRSGFSVDTDVALRYEFFDGERRGFVSLVAKKNGGVVAIELDRRTPRLRSVHKLRAMNAYRVAAVRGPAARLPYRIHKVVSLDVAR